MREQLCAVSTNGKNNKLNTFNDLDSIARLAISVRIEGEMDKGRPKKTVLNIIKMI